MSEESKPKKSSKSNAKIEKLKKALAFYKEMAHPGLVTFHEKESSPRHQEYLEAKATSEEA